MEFLNSMQNRYTTKMYDSTKKIDSKIIEQLKAVLHLSPSSINSQPWRFTFVRDETLKIQLAKESMFNEPKVVNASHLVVFSVLDNIDDFESHLTEGQANYYNRMIKLLPEEEIRQWMSHQVYLALGVFLSACAQMGVDSTPMEGIEVKAYDKILDYKNYKTLFAVAIGYRDKEDANQIDKNPKSRLPFDEVVKML